MSAKRKFQRKMKKSQLEDSESQLANATIENYQYMLDYCKHIHQAFTSMIHVADTDDSVDADPTLREWTEEQIEILEKIFAYDDAREELLNTVVSNTVSKMPLGKSDILN